MLAYVEYAPLSLPPGRPNLTQIWARVDRLISGWVLLVRAIALNGIWFLPLVCAGWPAFRSGDPVLLGYCGIVFLASGVAAVIADPISMQLRQGGDRRAEVVLSLSLFLAVMIGALDHARFHFSDAVPSGLRVVGLATVLTGYLIRLETVRVNRFFSGVIVVQREREHRVVDSGPYAIVRHPGYASLLLILPSIPLVFGSLFAFIPIMVALAILLRRTHREDVFLHDALPGYREYARRVPFRLVPGLF